MNDGAAPDPQGDKGNDGGTSIQGGAGFVRLAIVTAMLACCAALVFVKPFAACIERFGTPADTAETVVIGVSILLLIFLGALLSLSLLGERINKAGNLFIKTAPQQIGIADADTDEDKLRKLAAYRQRQGKLNAAVWNKGPRSLFSRLMMLVVIFALMFLRNCAHGHF